MTLTFSPTGSWSAASAPLAVDAGLRGLTRIARRFHGYEATRAAPMAAFAKSWLRGSARKGPLRCWVRGVMDLVKDANATGFA